MATSLHVYMHALIEAMLTPSSPIVGDHLAKLENATGGERFTQGIASGMADRVYLAEKTLSASATDNYNTLAAGSLTDIDGQAIDLDELKGLFIKCTSGSIRIDAPASGFLTIFSDATDLINLASGQFVMFGFGAAGLGVTASSKFDITDTAGGSGSTYSICFFGAQ